MKAMTATDCPAGYYGNDYFIHESNLALYVKNIESVNAVCTFIACIGSNALVSSRTKGPPTVFSRWPFAGNKYYTYVLTLMTDD